VKQRVEIRLLALPVREQLATGHNANPDARRQLVIVRVEDSDGAAGWGECAALNQPTYTAEWAENAFDSLAAGRPEASEQPMAAAALEMANLDAQLKTRGVSLASHLGATRATVQAGAAVGLMPTADLIERLATLTNDGIARVKLKIEPGHEIEPAAAALATFPGLELHVDGNGSFGPAHLGTLAEMGALGVAVIEQPFATNDTSSAATLRKTGVAVIADEGVSSVADAERLLVNEAISGISIKPPRVGGIAAAVEMLAWCTSNNMRATAGGMLECGLGRHALAAVAALDGFDITGDVSPARRWLAADPFPDVATLGSSVVVPTGPGVAPEPDIELLDRYTIKTATRIA
jgi:o-succinylbenzoate synthase